MIPYSIYKIVKGEREWLTIHMFRVNRNSYDMKQYLETGYMEDIFEIHLSGYIVIGSKILTEKMRKRVKLLFQF